MAYRNAPVDVGHSNGVDRGDVAQIVGVIGGPIVLLTGLAVKYAIVEVYACKSAVGPLLVHAAALATLLLTLATGLLARRQWRGAGREDPEDCGGREGRTRTMAALGVGMSALCAVTVVAQWMPQLFLDPCKQ